MARDFTVGSVVLQRTSSVPISGYPLSASGWINASSVSGTPATIWNQANPSGSGYVTMEYWAVGGDPANTARARLAGNPGQMHTTTYFSINEWHHICIAIDAGANAAVWLDGGGKNTMALGGWPGGATRMHIGGMWYWFSWASRWVNGYIADVALWNLALGDANAADLASGVCPLNVEPEGLLCYWPLFNLIPGSTGEQDWISGYDVVRGTGTTPPAASGPPNIYTFPDPRMPFGEAGGPGPVVVGAPQMWPRMF